VKLAFIENLVFFIPPQIFTIFHFHKLACHQFLFTKLLQLTLKLL
jgi:hypothetical protein